MSHLIRVEVTDDHVATVEFERGPRNHFDAGLIAELADTFERLDADPNARAIVLCSSGRHFCAGADLPGALNGSQPTVAGSAGSLYEEAVRLFAARTPIVAAVQGAAVGGGLGLALVADFRVAGPSTRFIANFSRLGLHQGFGITVTLPAVVGMQRAQELLYTGREVPGGEAFSIGLCDRLVGDDVVRSGAHAVRGRGRRDCAARCGVDTSDLAWRSGGTGPRRDGQGTDRADPTRGDSGFHRRSVIHRRTAPTPLHRLVSTQPAPLPLSTR
ncbi:enoyl-CoA hydratase/isomerase family protein [Mycobacterium sp.]|uniref:enoyl-CoA hydratase/isomerase family protein n=1 Tax=Mycobacterium sp. TaxID=1785 RepID=UPI003D0F3AA8